MECILIRHGIAVERDEWEGTDEMRPLTERGKKRVRQAAAGLAALGCKPTHLFTSSFVRAYETARLLRTVVCPGLKVERREELAVGAKPEQLVSILQTLPSDAVALCVGHEPFLGEVVSLFLCGKVLLNFPIKKAGAACIEVDGKGRAGQYRLRWWLPPMQLRVLGKRARMRRQREQS